MLIHADFSQPIIITPQDYDWIRSPGGEVNRMMLDRIGQEKARATSVVEFSPNSQFPEHSHPLGEEVLVLSGTFTENLQQDYPTGWYMRNPHQSRHQVSSQSGCKIFVKLMQMTEDELHPTRIDTHDPKNWQVTQGRLICPLFTSNTEHTFLEKLQAQQVLRESVAHGIEILVLLGELHAESKIYPKGTWIRLPPLSTMQFCATDLGATIYVKSAHLPHAMNVWSDQAPL
ncbi:cupin domain-containing protein [uncultured Acinetobacter sp.]|uniref:cupin domain-containing protein n=1 Tax=uncultured Acinetobacter sp. TaxID=165433 RepID=UPI00261D55E3|nr:cupin domain-containing protein [uncultured Acinetobacter sp.]